MSSSIEQSQTGVPAGAGEVITAQERRGGRRSPAAFAAELLGPGATEALICQGENVSEGGLHLRVPRGYGLAVGQRFEVQFKPAAEPSEVTHLAEETHYATVVRTEPHRYSSTSDVGVGLRFDQPLFF